MRLWDVETGRCLRVLEGHTDQRLSVGVESPISAMLSPAPMTKLYGCGTWRQDAACVCSKAIRASI